MDILLWISFITGLGLGMLLMALVIVVFEYMRQHHD